MRTEIINIGDELLIGQVVNTNASWMAERLNQSGFSVMQVSVVRDKGDEIMQILKEAGERSDIVIITGGLGPTKDDITKKVLCEYFDTKLIFNEDAYRDIEKLFGERGFEVTPLNRTQAEIPEKSIPLRNKNGTAPGMWFEKTENGRNIIMISLPGVPFEMKAITDDEVIPRLKEKFSPHQIFHKTILTQGIGESFLSDMIEEWENQLPSNIKLAYLPQPGIVRLRMTATGENSDEVKNQVLTETEKLKKIAGEYIFGEDNETLEEITGRLLRENKQSLSVAESCTGGYISHLITSVAGSSEYFRGGITAYANEVKQKELNVSEESLRNHGAVSEAVVREMAEGVLKKFGTSYSVATSGIAGPGGGTETKPVGLTWIAVASHNQTIAKSYLFGDNRERNIRKAGLQALNLLRKMILEESMNNEQ